MSVSFPVFKLDVGYCSSFTLCVVVTNIPQNLLLNMLTCYSVYSLLPIVEYAFTDVLFGRVFWLKKELHQQSYVLQQKV